MSTGKSPIASRDKTTRSDNVLSTAFNLPKAKVLPIISNTSNKPANSTSKTKQPSYVYNGSTAGAVSRPTFANAPSKAPVAIPMLNPSTQTKPGSPSKAQPSQASPSMSGTSGSATAGFVPTAKPDDSEAPLGLTMRTGLKVELAFGLVALLCYVGLSIFITTRICYNTKMDVVVFWAKVFVIVGAVVSSIVCLYCFFERHLAPREGLTNCLFMTTLIATATINLVMAYLSIGCICRCAKSAFADTEERADLVIFILEIIGSISLLLVVFTSSVTRMTS